MNDWSTLKKLIWQRSMAGGEQDVDLTVTGTSPLSLPNASAKKLVSLTQYGKLTLSGTPSPSNPATLSCNLGDVLFTDYETPEGYRRLSGITMNGSTYYKITGLKLNGSDSVALSISATASCNVFGCYTTTAATDNYSLYISTTSGSKYLRYNGGAYKSYWSSSDFGERFDIWITPDGSQGMPQDQDDTWEPADFTASVDMCIGTTSTGATSAKFKGTFYGIFWVYDGDFNVKFQGIPVERISDGVIGYYDAISETFYEPTGTAPTILGYDTSNFQLSYTDGETITVGSTFYYPYVPLWAVGEAVDTIECVSGKKTIAVDAYVFTGEELFEADNTYGAAVKQSGFFASTGETPICTHFVGIATVSSGTQNADTVFFDSSSNLYFRTSKTPSEFAAWLVQQAAGGTPVILLYSRDPYSVNVDKLNVTLAAGTNTVRVDSVINPTLTAVYKGKESA